MSGVDAYAVRIAIMLDLLPWGSADRGVTSKEVATRLASRGIRVDPNTVLRDLKSWRKCFGLIRQKTSSGKWLWKRPNRRVSLSHMLRVHDYVGASTGSSEDGVLQEHAVPDWSSEIIFWD